ncbi:MAG TPA: glycoside hydrolase family 140 protein [Prolixibacteraceae bacterium]|nr:glycoside hydrolase family 140 protein [Prolixibacteraceae bacterium]
MKKFVYLILFLAFAGMSPAKSLPLLRISDDHRYLVAEDGNPFFWLGDTAWELLHRLNREETILYLNDRAKKGFTLIQTVVLAELDGLRTPNANGDVPLIDLDPERFNEAYFQHVDWVLNEAEKRGLYIGLLPTWGDKFNQKWGVGPVIFHPHNAEKFGASIAKRYQNQNNIVWILGGDRLPENDEHFAIVRAMAQGIRQVDSRHLITYHPSGAQKATNVFNDEWLDLDMFQSGHSRDTRDYRYVWESRAVNPARPVINGEPRYENIPDRFWDPGEHPWMDDSDVRVCAYWSMLAGAAGYTYGCNDIWQMYDVPHAPSVNARTGWKEALHLPGSMQMKHMKALFMAFPWYEMEYDPSIILGENPENPEFKMSAIGKNKDFIIAYTPWGRPLKVDLSKMKTEKAEAFWFNPRSGRSLSAGSWKTSEDHVFTPWATGRGSDFVLVVLPANQVYPLPL